MAKKQESRATSSSHGHWQKVYDSHDVGELSWYQKRPQLSLRLIRNAGVGLGEPIIDVGGGASTLVDALLEKDYQDLTVVDLSETALDRSRQRLGNDSKPVRWLVADILTFEPERRYALWHDRALFHFMTRRARRRAYIEAMGRALRPGGQAIMATFAIEGPRKCSGLGVVRYDARRLLAELGPDYELLQSVDETHHTPAGAMQAFTYFRLRRL